MPHLVRWNEELGDFGLAMIGFHVQDAPADEVKMKSEALRITFPVLQGGDVPKSKKEGIPRMFVFGPDGELLLEGRPAEAEQAVRAAVGKALVKAAGIKEPHSSLKKIVEDLQAGKPPVAAVTKVLPLAKSADPKLKEQASALAAALQAGGNKRLQEAKDGQKDDPITSYDGAVRLAANFKGTPIAQQASELSNKLRSEKRVAAELRARPILDSIKKLDQAMAPGLKETESVTPEFKKAFSSQLKQMANQLAQLNRTYADTRAAKEAAAIAAKYEVK